MRYKKGVFRSLAMVSQLGFCVIASIFLCTFAGWCIDKYLGTRLIVLFLVIGAAAGGWNAYKLAKKTMEAEIRDDERALDDQLRRAYKAPTVSKPKQPSRIISAKQEGAKKAEPSVLTDSKEETDD